MNLQVIPAPYSDIRAYELDEFGQPVAYFYDTLEVCYGEPVFLEAISAGIGYIYQWSTGQSGQVVEYSEDRGNLLAVGQHDISLTVTSQINGCGVTVGPFVINVHPNPAVVQINTQPTGLLCESTPITFSVDTPEAGVNYFWNTGQSGPSIVNTNAGDYFAVAVNAFGCRAQSNTINVLEGPNVRQVPSGCHTRCLPDTICVPPITGAVSYQWYLDGNALPGPEGTMLNLAPTQSGNYTLEVTDATGCKLTSADLNLDLFTGYGTISGSVYVDVNDNGVIDPSDTLYNGGGVFITDASAQIDTIIMANGGAYIWVNAPANAYTLVFDTLSLPSGYQAVYVQVDSSLVGCADSMQVDWLLRLCPTLISTTDLSFCQGETIDYGGQTYSVDTTFAILHQALSGCDSIENVTIDMLPTQTLIIDMATCPGVPVMYEGTSLDAGDHQDFVYTNQYGCDSTISVSVLALPTDASSLSLQACPGISVNYNGTDLSVGDQIPFTLTNSLGCDSVVTVTVTALPTSATSLSLQTCPGTTVNYNGTDLAVGDQVDFTFSNSLGCDSVVTVMVLALPISTSSLTLQTCPGDPITYNGSTLNVGDQIDFTFTNSLGCDSIVTVTVSALLTSSGVAQLQACTGTSVTYNGQTLLPGTQTDVVLTNSVGCDSVVTVTVTEIFPDTADLQLVTCPGEPISYQGTILQAGDMVDFTLTNQAGCDSIVRVSVSALITDTTQVPLQACEGTTIDFNGITISAGDTQEVILTDQQGCDSVIVVSVLALPAPTFSLSGTASCPNNGTGTIRVANVAGNGPFEYSIDGNTFQTGADFAGVEAGDYVVVVQDANGCISENTIDVPTLESLTLSAEEFTLPCNELQIDISVNILSGLVGQIDYLWDNGDTTAVRSVTAAGVYALEVSNDCETVSQNVEVVPEVKGKLGIFYIPNVFSPNSDGINDLFQVFTGEGVQVEQFQLNVFDRWGNMLYSSEDYTAGWDGDYRSKAMNPGVYVWHLKAVVFRCGQLVGFEDKGDVTIVR
ncbi:MAG: gliding motility-associated C-terminal domain-containing protein [Saprospiraceae bacterium]|nr:gliding motility-associated C-terminal domain-containing protein [Saprospiraceae bacterium]